MATLSIPDRTLKQRHEALTRANSVRVRRAALKASVRALSARAGRERVAEVLDEPPDFIESMRLEDLLLTISRFGDRKVWTLLWAFKISPRKRVGGLSARQRRELADMLRSYAPRDLGGGR